MFFLNGSPCPEPLLFLLLQNSCLQLILIILNTITGEGEGGRRLNFFRFEKGLSKLTSVIKWGSQSICTFASLNLSEFPP